VAVLIVLGVLAAPACASGSTARTPTAHTAHEVARSATKFDGTTTVGALFPSAALGFHVCTASVVASASRSVIMTAAHCVTGHDAGYVFAPGYHDGKTPYGKWRVVAAYGAPGWVKHTSSRDDFAFLVVAARTIHGRLTRLQTVTGANRLGTTPQRGQRVTVPAYPLGIGGRPIRCTARVFFQGVYPGFHCGGYVDGTSGSPWLRGHGTARRVVGVIGGLHQGGCQASTSYSPPLGPAAQRALKRAGRNHGTDRFPAPPGDGCS
jgi:V8-like Glu-specific endopeptidase